MYEKMEKKNSFTYKPLISKIFWFITLTMIAMNLDKAHLSFQNYMLPLFPVPGSWAVSSHRCQAWLDQFTVAYDGY